MSLKNQVYGIDKFRILDHSLAFYKDIYNGEEPILILHNGDPNTTSTAVGNLICVYGAWGVYDGGNWNQFTPWQLLYCYRQSMEQLTTEPAGSGGTSGGTPPPPPTDHEFEQCQKKFIDMVDATDGSSNQISGTSTDIDPLNRSVSIGWVLVTNPVGWQVNSYWIGDITRATANSTWTWGNLKFDKVEVVGTVIGGSVTPSLNSTIINYDAPRRYATVSTNITLQNAAGCIKPLTRTLIFNKWTVFDANQF